MRRAADPEKLVVAVGYMDLGKVGDVESHECKRQGKRYTAKYLTIAIGKPGYLDPAYAHEMDMEASEAGYQHWGGWR